MSHVANTLKCMNAARHMQAAIKKALPLMREHAATMAIVAKLSFDPSRQAEADQWLEATIVMELALKESMPEPEYVQHVDGNPINNELSNLCMVKKAVRR